MLSSATFPLTALHQTKVYFIQGTKEQSLKALLKADPELGAGTIAPNTPTRSLLSQSPQSVKEVILLNKRSQEQDR